MSLSMLVNYPGYAPRMNPNPSRVVRCRKKAKIQIIISIAKKFGLRREQRFASPPVKSRHFLNRGSPEEFPLSLSILLQIQLVKLDL